MKSKADIIKEVKIIFDRYQADLERNTASKESKELDHAKMEFNAFLVKTLNSLDESLESRTYSEEEQSGIIKNAVNLISQNKCFDEINTKDASLAKASIEYTNKHVREDILGLKAGQT